MCGPPLSSIDPSISQHLESKVCDFISDYKWNIPFSVLLAFPSLPQFINHIIIPKLQLQDELIWKGAPYGSLSFKEAFTFKSPSSQKLQWAKTAWSPDITPSK